MPIYSSDSDDHTPIYSASNNFFGSEKPLHAILGGGKAADIVLWRNNKLSAAILIGSTIIWSLFEVGEYNFITLVCHISIITMLILFLWSYGASLIDWNPPDHKTITIPESTIQWLFDEFNKILLNFYQVSSGQDLKTFFLVITFLWIMSGIGNYFSSPNLLYIGFLGLMSLPALYERYQNEVDNLAHEGNRKMNKMYKKFDKEFLDKIPRGPTGEKKKF